MQYKHLEIVNNLIFIYIYRVDIMLKNEFVELLQLKIEQINKNYIFIKTG